MARGSIFNVQEVRNLMSDVSAECKISLLKEGRTGKRSTRAAREAYIACLREKFRNEVAKKVGALTKDAYKSQRKR